MGNFNSVEIVFNKPSYYPGETISGKICMDVKRTTKLRHIHLQFLGYGEVNAVQIRSSNCEPLKLREHYMNFVVKIFDKGTIHAGEHYIYFEDIKIPKDIPSSCHAENKSWRIRYKCIAFLRDVQSLHIYEKSETDLNIINPFRVDEDPNHWKPVRYLRDPPLTLRCDCCSKQGEVICQISVNQSCFIPGDILRIDYNIENNSAHFLKQMEAVLKQHVIIKQMISYRRGQTSKNKTLIQDIFRLNMGNVQPGQTIIKKVKYEIPEIPSSYLIGCKLLDLNYVVEIETVPKLSNSICLPIVIGTERMTSQTYPMKDSPKPTIDIMIESNTSSKAVVFTPPAYSPPTECPRYQARPEVEKSDFYQTGDKVDEEISFLCDTNLENRSKENIYPHESTLLSDLDATKPLMDYKSQDTEDTQSSFDMILASLDHTYANATRESLSPLLDESGLYESINNPKEDSASTEELNNKIDKVVQYLNSNSNTLSNDSDSIRPLMFINRRPDHVDNDYEIDDSFV